MTTLKPRGVRLAHKLDCPTCGYVRGATCGYDKLTKQERAFLVSLGCEITKSLVDDEIVRMPGEDTFYCARSVLHRLYCTWKNRYDRVLIGSEVVA